MYLCDVGGGEGGGGGLGGGEKKGYLRKGEFSLKRTNNLCLESSNEGKMGRQQKKVKSGEIVSGYYYHC